MKPAAIAIGALALIGTIIPPLLFMLGSLGEGPMKAAMLAACLVWFVTAPVWMRAS